MANLHEAANDLRIAVWSITDALGNARGTAYEAEIERALTQIKTLARVVREASDDERRKALANP